MTLSNEKLVDLLNDLLETCYDGLEGFRTAASTVTSPEAIVLFQSRAQRLDEAAAELYTEIRRNGGMPVEHGHSQARIHRGWIHVRAAVAQHTDEAVLAEVERGEEEAARRYRKALKQDLSESIHDLLTDHLAAIDQSLANVKAMRS